MKTPHRDLVFVLVSASILLLVCSLASISASNRQIPKSNSEKEAQGELESKKYAAQEKIKASLSSDFSTAIEETLKTNNVVMTCETQALFVQFYQSAINKASITAVQQYGVGDPVNNQTMNDAQKEFRVFLNEQIKAGEKLKGGRVLLTGESFNEARGRICPLIPIC